MLYVCLSFLTKLHLMANNNKIKSKTKDSRTICDCQAGLFVRFQPLRPDCEWSSCNILFSFMWAVSLDHFSLSPTAPKSAGWRNVVSLANGHFTV